MIPRINYSMIGSAVSFYSLNGFDEIEVPWAVRPEISEITCPKDRTPFQVWHPTLVEGQLVGSAELGFLQLMRDGKLPKGQYVAAGPCWRDDPLDTLHQRYFFKVELIDTREPFVRGKPNEEELLTLVYRAKRFMSQYDRRVQIVRTPIGYDLELNDIEVGSYGIRRFEDLEWIYGTGLALPRFEQAMQR